MAAKVSVSITATTQQNKDKTRTLGYVNPEATNEQLQQMAAAYNALSTKVYQTGEKIVRTDLAEPGSGKQEPTLTITKAKRTGMNGFDMTVTYNDVAQGIDGIATYKVNNNNVYINILDSIVILSAESSMTDFKNAIFTVYVPETENYAAKKVEYSDWQY